MKILLVSNFFDGTGYSHAGISLALAMDAAGLDVVCRRLKLNEVNGEVPPRIHELEAGDAAGCDTAVIHTLPNLMDVDHRLRCIAHFASETNHFKSSGWAESLNRFNEVWAISNQGAQACRESGVRSKLSVIPHATDVRRFERSYAPLPAVKEWAGDSFCFYTIGEFNRRKNIAALLRAFHSEFAPDEPVKLVVRSCRVGVKPEEFRNEWEGFHNAIINGLGLYRRPEMYQQPLLLPDRLSEADVLRLHTTCDCYVSPACGEAWGLATFDAMALGRTPIAPNWGGHLDYLSDETGYLVKSRLEPCFSNDGPPGLYTAESSWASVDVNDLRRGMRLMYSDAELRKKKAGAGLKRAYDFSYGKIGNLIKNTLLETRSGESEQGRTSLDHAKG